MTIKYGTTRIVILTSRWAIKLPALTEWRLLLLGLLGNMQETRFSKAKWPQLCPVRFALPGGFLVLMPRADQLSREQFSAFSALDYAEWIKGGEPLAKGEWIIPVENKLDSFGVLDGRIVAVDYGS